MLLQVQRLPICIVICQHPGLGKAIDTEIVMDDVEAVEDISKAVTEDLTGCVSNVLRIHMDGDIPLKEELLQHVQSVRKRVRY